MPVDKPEENNGVVTSPKLTVNTCVSLRPRPFLLPQPAPPLPPHNGIIGINGVDPPFPPVDTPPNPRAHNP